MFRNVPNTCRSILDIAKTYLVHEKRSHKFSWLKDVHNFADQIIVGRLGEVGFKADVGKLGLWSAVDRPISSLRGKICQ